MSVCVLDIETNDLCADRGRFLFGGVYDPKRDKAYSFAAWDYAGRCTHTTERRAIAECLNFISSFDLLVTFYGTRFDLPFVTARNVALRGVTPAWPKHVDLFYVARRHLKLRSRSLANLGRFSGCRLTKPTLGEDCLDKLAWVSTRRAAACRRRCLADCRLTWEVYRRLVRSLGGVSPRLQEIKAAFNKRSVDVRVGDIDGLTRLEE